MNGLLGDDREAARLREALGKPPHQRADMEVKEVQEFLASLVLLRGLPSAALAQWAQAAHYGRVQEEAGECDRFFAAGEADVSTFYIVLAGRVALACPAAAEEQSQAPAAGSPARLRDRGQSSHLRKTLSRPEACAESGKGRPQIPEEVIAELGAGDSFGEEAIFSLGEADRDIAEATDTICALDYTNRKYSAWRLSRDLEFLAVRDEEVLASLLQHHVGELQMRPTLATESLLTKPYLRSEHQLLSVARVLSTAGIFALHRPPQKHVINLLALHAEYVERTEGDMLYSEGQPLDAVFCLLSGNITVMRQRGRTDGQVGRSLEMAGEVRTEGVLLGKMVEAYVRGHDDQERQLALAKQTAQETAEVALERLALQELHEQVTQIQDTLAAQNLDVSDTIARVSSLKSHIQQSTSTESNSASDEVEALEKQRRQAEYKAQASGTGDLQEQLRELQRQIQSHESKLKIHNAHLLDVEGAVGKEFQGVPGACSDDWQRAKTLGELDDAWECTHKRAFSAVSAGKSHVLKFPIRVWQEACQSDMIYLSTRTFERQMQALGIFPTQLLLGVAGVGIEVKHCSNEGSKQARVTSPKKAKEARVSSPKMQTDVRSVSALQEYSAANTAFFLGNFELLSHLPPHSHLKLALKSKLRAFEPHTVILSQGLPWPSVDGNQVAYLILSGQLRKHKKALGGEVDTDRWHAFHQLLQARALCNPSSNDKTNLVAPETSVANPSKYEDMRGKDVWAAVAECFGPLEQCVLHGTVVGENHLMFGRDAKSLATYITGTQVLALEVKVQDLVEIDGEASGVVAHPHLAASVLQREPSSRDERDLDILSGCIHRVPFFATLPAKALSELCHKATLRSLMPGEILFEHGDEADEIFIVLSGTLGVHAMPSKVSETEEQEREKEADEAVAPALNVTFSTCEAATCKAAPDGKSRGDASIVGPCTGLRTEGQSIGQAILYSSSIKATRKTSVKARGKAAVMVMKLADLIAYQSFVNRRSFFEPAKMMQVLFEPSLRSDDDLLAIGEFVRSLPLFSAFEAAELSVLAKYVRAERKSAGTVLYRRQEHLSALYFLVQGTAAICRPDPLQEDMDAIQKSNAQRFEAGHVVVKDADVQQVSKYGVIQHFARDGDALVQEVTGRGPDALARLAKDTSLFSHSCILVKPSIVASLNFKSVAEYLAEWKQIEAEEALMVLSRSYPFNSWKQKEVAVLACLAQHLVYQRGSRIFEQASAADRIFLVQKGEVSLVQKGMSHLVPSAPVDAGKEPIRRQHTEKGTISAESRRADIAVTTVSNGGVLGVDLVKQLNTEKGKTVAIKLAETEGKLLQAQKDLKKSLNDNMSRSFLQSIQAQINALTRQRNDLLSQQHKIKTEGVLRHQYRAVVASSVVKLIAVRRVDIDSIGPRGSTTQIDKHHRNVVDHRAGFRSDFGSKHEMRLLQGFGGRRDDAALGDEVASEQSAIQERRRFVGDVRDVAALSGQRGGRLLKEDNSVSPQAAVASLMNLRKWLRKKYGKLGSAATILSCFHGGEVISDSALKALCDESACGLKPAQLRTAIARPSSSYARVDSKDKVTYLPAPRSGGIDRGEQMSNDGMDDNHEQRNEVIFFSDLKKTLDNEEMLIDAAMRVARRGGNQAENAVAEHPPAYGAPPDVLPESALPHEDTSCIHVISDSLETSFSSQKKVEQDRRAAGREERAGGEQRETLFELGRPHSAMTTRDRSQNLRRDEQRPSSAAESRAVRRNKFALIPGESEDDPYILQEMPGDLSQESALEINENARRSLSPRRQAAIAARVDSERPASAMSFRSDGHSRHGGHKGPMHVMSGRFPRPKTAFTRRSEWAAGIDRELDAFDGDFQSTIFSNRSHLIEGLKRKIGIKTEKIKYNPIMQPVKLEQLRTEYTAQKGARPWSALGTLGTMPAEAAKNARTSRFGLSSDFFGKTPGPILGSRNSGKIHKGVTTGALRASVNLTGAQKKQGKDVAPINIQLRLPH